MGKGKGGRACLKASWVKFAVARKSHGKTGRQQDGARIDLSGKVLASDT